MTNEEKLIVLIERHKIRNDQMRRIINAQTRIDNSRSESEYQDMMDSLICIVESVSLEIAQESPIFTD